MSSNGSSVESKSILVDRLILTGIFAIIATVGLVATSWYCYQNIQKAEIAKQEYAQAEYKLKETQTAIDNYRAEAEIAKREADKAKADTEVAKDEAEQAKTTAEVEKGKAEQAKAEAEVEIGRAHV